MGFEKPGALTRIERSGGQATFAFSGETPPPARKRHLPDARTSGMIGGDAN
jgi:hypothetical protein